MRGDGAGMAPRSLRRALSQPQELRISDFPLVWAKHRNLDRHGRLLRFITYMEMLPLRPETPEGGSPHGVDHPAR